MEFFRNFPFFSIVLCLMSGVISSILPKKAARILSYVVTTVLTVFSVCTLIYTIQTGTFFVYRMGHFDAPWGNEIRAGQLEGLMAVFFCVIMFLSLLAGEKYIDQDVKESKGNLYYALTNLMMSSLLSLIYTNDLFTAYVFVEINTISACGLIAIRGNGRSLVASAKYMIMSLLGSGLILIGITLLYDVTGHLLMSNIKESVEKIVATGQYAEPLTIIIALLTIGLAIKSALFPFHSWLPEAYGYATASSSSILSSLVSKAYIFILIKIFYRVIGIDIIRESKISDVIFVFGLIGMIIGSVFAILQKDIKRMIAYSSVAQIGYIFMGFGIATELGMIASIYHIFMHASTKSMLFMSFEGIRKVSGDSSDLDAIKGAGYRNKTAGVAFAVGCASMVGIPLFAGFVAKLSFANAAIDAGMPKMIIVMLTLALSTILNAVYFFRALISIYTPAEGQATEDKAMVKSLVAMSRPVFLIGFIVVNIAIGTCCDYVLGLIETGLKMFG